MCKGRGQQSAVAPSAARSSVLLHSRVKGGGGGGWREEERPDYEGSFVDGGI